MVHPRGGLDRACQEEGTAHVRHGDLDQMERLEIRHDSVLLGRKGGRGGENRQTRQRAQRTWDGTPPEEPQGAGTGFYNIETFPVILGGCGGEQTKYSHITA